MSEPDPSKKRRRRKRSKKDTHADDAADSDNEETTPPAKSEAAISPEDVEDAKLDVIDKDPATENQNEEGDEGDDAAANEGKPKRKRKRKRKTKSGDDAADGSNNDNSTNAPTDADAAKFNSMEHTVFIEGLPFTSSEDEVRSFFAEHGCNDILQLRLPTWQDSGRLRGFGHVVFASTETRTRALSDEVNRKEMGGRYITIKEANAPRAGTTAGAVLGGEARAQPKGCKTLYIRNLPYEASEEQILETFQVCGKIVEGGVRVVRDHVRGQSKGFGYVEYKNEEGALSAVQKASKPFGLTVLKRPVFVDYDEGSMKGSFRDREGKLWSKEHGDNGGRGGGGRGGRGFGGRGGRGRGFGGRGGRGY